MKTRGHDCLAASLTLLVKHNIINLEQTENILGEEGYEGLFEYLNRKFKEQFGEGLEINE